MFQCMHNDIKVWKIAQNAKGIFYVISQKRHIIAGADILRSSCIAVVISDIIIQQIVMLSKYGHDALDICHP